jgi:DNA polymerase III epsilon subunit-like protein
VAHRSIYSRHHPGKWGLCIDWETTGADFGEDSSVNYQGIAFGAIVFDIVTCEPVDELYRELHFDGTKYKWTDTAEKIHGLSREHLLANGVSREEGLADLIEMMIKYWPPGFFAAKGEEPTSKIMLAGHNKGFDMDFTNQLFDDNNMAIEFNHVGMDSTMIAFAVSGLYKSDDVFMKFAGVDKRSLHNALEDAHAALTVLRTIRQIFQVGEEALDA